MSGLRIGIDLGGTKIEGILLDATGKRLAGARVDTPRNDYDGTLRAIARLVAELEREAGAASVKASTKASIGIGMPGAISPATGLVKNANSIWLNGRSFDRDIEAVLKRPVRIANDANCFALSEAVDGAGAGRNIVFGVILGTGVGGGIVIGGQVLKGGNAIAGEWGHTPLPHARDHERPGPLCYCGKRGCIETWLSGPALAADMKRRSGRNETGAAIAAAAARGDVWARDALDDYRDRLARALSVVCNIIDPDVIVLGGGVSNIAPIMEGLETLLAGWCFSDAMRTSIVAAKHGDASGVRGAAWLWNGS